MPTPYALSSDLVSAWPAKSLAVAQYVDGYKLDTGPVQNAQTGTTYTFVLADTTKTVTANNAAASAYTIPPQSSVVWEAYTVLRLVNLGAGVVTLTAGAGVTLTGTLTVPQYGSVTIMRTASNAWTISGTSDAPGMVLVTPTSVAGSGVTLSGGKVTFTAATSISINGCFTSAYDNYMAFIDVTKSADNAMNARMRLAGSDASTAAYEKQSLYANSTSVSSASATGQTNGEFCYGNLTKSVATVSIFGPALAERTNWRSVSSISTFIFDLASLHTVATAYDGITIYPASGTATGTLRIYGLRNS